MSDAPIGIFDSGVGGLTVARAIVEQLPNEAIIYVGDSAHAPYGDKSLDEVRRYALTILDDLVDRGVKMLVIACNTASAAMLPEARARYTVPVIEVIQPAVRRAVASTRNRRIGVIGTSATMGSGAYQAALGADDGIEVFAAACPRFVEFVERGVTSGPELMAVAEAYLEPLRKAEVDTLVLGCTHYPFLKGALGYVMGPGVALVSSDDETAVDVYRTLVDRGMERKAVSRPRHVFETTGADVQAFLDLSKNLMGVIPSTVKLLETGPIDLLMTPQNASPAGTERRVSD